MTAAAASRPQLAGLSIADLPARWRALGFAVDHDGRVRLGGVTLALGASGRGITGWTLRNVAADGVIDGAIDGLPTAVTTQPAPVPTTVAPGCAEPPAAHPNGAVGVDHVVIMTPDFDRTATTLAQRGLEVRRVRQVGDRRQGFRRLGPAIMEIVEAPEARVPFFWGLTVLLADLQAPGSGLAAQLGAIRPAVQPGRHIATLDVGAGLSTRIAFMD